MVAYQQLKKNKWLSQRQPIDNSAEPEDDGEDEGEPEAEEEELQVHVDSEDEESSE